MKKIEIICPTMKLEDLKKTIYAFDIGGFLVTNITGVGFMRGPEKERSVKYIEMPKIKVEFVIKDENVELVIKEITKVLQTGRVGDGKIFVCPADSVVRIRTGEENAV
ncbi:MAG: P-II family nitrogen regulator [Elusimicrobia bacterium]|nr:P-II family nitrogen regulator [Elusimicrobiota bacterium]